jgi:hypothetical protein
MPWPSISKRNSQPNSGDHTLADSSQGPIALRLAQSKRVGQSPGRVVPERAPNMVAWPKYATTNQSSLEWCMNSASRTWHRAVPRRSFGNNGTAQAAFCQLSPTSPGSDTTSRTIRIEEPSMPKGIASTLSAEKLRDLARAGAEVALKRLRAEIIAIERAFPELALPKKRRALRRTLKQATNRTSRMSAATRQAVSVRMKRYWAERRRARARLK